MSIGVIENCNQNFYNAANWQKSVARPLNTFIYTITPSIRR